MSNKSKMDAARQASADRDAMKKPTTEQLHQQLRADGVESVREWIDKQEQ